MKPVSGYLVTGDEYRGPDTQRRDALARHALDECALPVQKFGHRSMSMSRGAEEQRSRGAEEQRSRGAGAGAGAPVCMVCAISPIRER